MKYLIIGNKGQLGKEFQKQFEQTGIKHSGFDIDKIDITNEKDVSNLISAEKPSVIINCAAYNQVDTAETEKDTAFDVNEKGVRNLCNAARQNSSFIIHYSTDYVFDGEKTNGLYTELDSTNPISIYGQSKLSGERIALDMYDASLVMRLSWVFGEGTQNFIYKLQQWAEKNEMLKIVYDEFSVPTYTATVVEVTLRALDKGLTGLFHLTNSGYCSRYEWAKYILRLLENDIFIYPCSIKDFALPAQRPKFSAMSNKKISSELDIEIIYWQEAVKSFFTRS